MDGIIQMYFLALFTSSSPTMSQVDSVLQSMESRLDPNLRDYLNGRFIEEDVQRGLFQMSPSKDPSEDGFPTIFFQKLWSVIGRQITDNAMIGFECMYTLRRKFIWKKKGFISIKLDMAKTYDKVKWCFVEGMMRRIGSRRIWIVSPRLPWMSINIKNLLTTYSLASESTQISETSLPLLNPYTVFKRSKSLSIRVIALVQHRSPPIKEYVQSTALDNCLVPASTAEQYIDLEIGQPLIDQWTKEGYSHIHIRTIRIVLTLYGRKGLSVTATIALLNTIYKEYEHAVIGTRLSTIHAGSISLTYYPNFNIPLGDQNLHNCLKVQLQVAGAPMMPNSYMATLHNQISYRLQDHAFDLLIPGHTGDTLFIKAEREDEVPHHHPNPKTTP
ncbi:hypothetical protein Ddye_004844 [Dipteronia dyeriana]|uniref:Reverse transcriptase domain-containing protein n=1 Tax=Dipteronia dyeriana TaxID=168575 RepID=A0AAD9XFL2_9ROSI|nr:hypothetical protein Ddye_004844 [Dipteronia dyeriana]